MVCVMATLRVVTHTSLTQVTALIIIFLVTGDLFALVQRCCQLHVSERIESDNLPLEFNFDLAGCVNVDMMTMHSCIVTQC